MFGFIFWWAILWALVYAVCNNYGVDLAVGREYRYRIFYVSVVVFLYSFAVFCSASRHSKQQADKYKTLNWIFLFLTIWCWLPLWFDAESLKEGTHLVTIPVIYTVFSGIFAMIVVGVFLILMKLCIWLFSED